jgi:TetR/AcrR family transcriptional regulator, lmrAB and yxaGH operons repressor
MTSVAKDRRRRMVVSAASLIGTRGIRATSLSDVREASRAPRGSIYHHFPAGKGERVGEAMRWTSEQVMAHQRSCKATTPGGMLEHFVSLFRQAVVSSHCEAGCPIAGVVVDIYSAGDPLLQIGRASFRAWSRLLTRQLVATGVDSRSAPYLATTILAAVEGALILCRAEQSVAPLETVELQLRQLVTGSTRTRCDSSGAPSTNGRCLRNIGSAAYRPRVSRSKLAPPGGVEMCRKCGGPVDRGVVAGEGQMTPATVVRVPNKRTPGTGGVYDSVELAPLPFWRWSAAPTFPAFLCPRCKLVEIAFGPPAPAVSVPSDSRNSAAASLPSGSSST